MREGDFGKYLRFVRGGLSGLAREAQDVKREVLDSLEMTVEQFDHAVLRFDKSLDEKRVDGVADDSK